MLDLIDPCKLQVLKHLQLWMNCHYYNGQHWQYWQSIKQLVSIGCWCWVCSLLRKLTWYMILKCGYHHYLYLDVGLLYNSAHIEATETFLVIPPLFLSSTSLVITLKSYPYLLGLSTTSLIFSPTCLILSPTPLTLSPTLVLSPLSDLYKS